MTWIKIKILICTLFVLLSCTIVKPPPVIIVDPTPLVIGSYTIVGPQTNVTYNYNDITKNIDIIHKAKEEAVADIEAIKLKEKKTVDDKVLEPEAKKNILNELKNKRDTITSKLPKIDEIRAAWENIGFVNDDYRTKIDSTDLLFSNLKLDDFKNFIGVTSGDYAGKATKIYGNPNYETSSYFSYDFGDKTVLSINFNEADGKIFAISLYGKEAYEFFKKKTSDFKFKLLGLKKYKIVQYLGRPGNTIKDKKTDNIEYTTGNGVLLTFYFSNNSCERIRVIW
jgi:hypothetical protein